MQLLQTLRKRSYMIGIQENQETHLKDPYLVNTEVIQLRFCRLVFRLRPSPSIQGATLTHHLDARRDSHAELVELIKKSLYVDELLTMFKEDLSFTRIQRN